MVPQVDLRMTLVIIEAPVVVPVWGLGLTVLGMRAQGLFGHL